MATAPQFVTTPNAGVPTKLTAANTALDGTGSNPVIFTAGSNGSLLPYVRVRHLGTNVATVVRLYLNNGSNQEVASNNALIAERTISANTLTQTAESLNYDIPLNMTLAGGHKILVSIGTAVAAGVMVSPMSGGDL